MNLSNIPKTSGAALAAVIAMALGTGGCVHTPQPPGVGIPNPASAHCVAIGGESRLEDSAAGQRGVCQLDDETVCDEWALYRGTCPEIEHFATAFDYCRTVVHRDALALSASPAGLGGDIIAAMRDQAVVDARMPDAVLAGTGYWRCMGAEPWVCVTGANLPCAEPADVRREPTPAMIAFCVDPSHPVVIPATVTGRTTIFEWRCRDGRPVIAGQPLSADARGYVAEYWTRLQPPND